jgi:excisionase family DNA binding protein
MTTNTPTRSVRPLNCRVASALPDLLTIDELSGYLRIPKNTLYAWRVTGQGPGGRILGRHLRYYKGDVLSWALDLPIKASE